MIEDALLRHRAVALAAAVGQPDAHAGELPVAYVTLKPGQFVPAEELAAFAREAVPERAAIPARIEIVAEMALTAVGKVAKAELRMRAAEHVLCTVLAENDIPADVRVRADLQRGTLALVKCEAHHAQRAHELLGHFPIPVEVSGCHSHAGDK
jgi:fatty-acyl-CoA synthase